MKSFASNHKMPEHSVTYARVQCIRVKNLELQIHLMHRELQRIRERMLPQEDLIRLGNILERLKELNLTLTDLRNHYNNMQQSSSYKKYETNIMKQKSYANKNIVNSFEGVIDREPQFEYECYSKQVKYPPREKAGNDQKKSLNTIEQPDNISKESQLNVQDSEIKEVQTLAGSKNEINEPFKTCKQLMEEIKPPGSILGNYLMKLQDFRTDPELRRQRWEKKQQEKLQQLQKRKNIVISFEDNRTSIEGIIPNNTNNYLEKLNSCSSLSDSSEIQSDQKEIIKSRIDLSPIRHKSETTDSGLDLDLPLIKNNLSKVVFEIINNIDQDAIALTIVLENDNLYHISVSLISSGHSLSCFLATEEAIQEAKQQHLFQDLLTFFVINADNSEAQKDRILGHSFEFIKMDVN